MDASTLQIGDWVLHDGKFKKIDVIWNSRTVSLTDPSETWGSIYTDKYLSEDIDSIPITKNFLDKNFGIGEYEPHGIYDDYFDFGIREISDSIYIATYRNCEMNLPDENVLISFVHELQHFLKHCKIDKEIKPC